MKKITIEGMACEHCVAYVKKALEDIGAKSVEVSLEGGYALADTDKSDEDIILAIAEEGYDATGIENV